MTKRAAFPSSLQALPGDTWSLSAITPQKLNGTESPGCRDSPQKSSVRTPNPLEVITKDIASLLANMLGTTLKKAHHAQRKDVFIFLALPGHWGHLPYSCYLLGCCSSSRRFTQVIFKLRRKRLEEKVGEKDKERSFSEDHCWTGAEKARHSDNLLREDPELCVCREHGKPNRWS